MRHNANLNFPTHDDGAASGLFHPPLQKFQGACINVSFLPTIMWSLSLSLSLARSLDGAPYKPCRHSVDASQGIGQARKAGELIDTLQLRPDLSD